LIFRKKALGKASRRFVMGLLCTRTKNWSKLPNIRKKARRGLDKFMKEIHREKTMG
jgi:hypothetical protein